jgi:hypothetical protein
MEAAVEKELAFDTTRAALREIILGCRIGEKSLMAPLPHIQIKIRPLNLWIQGACWIVDPRNPSKILSGRNLHAKSVSKGT